MTGALEDTNTEQEDKEDWTKIIVIGRLVARCGREWGAFRSPGAHGMSAY